MTSLPLTFYMHAFTTRTVTCLLHALQPACCTLHTFLFMRAGSFGDSLFFFVGEATCNSALRLVPTVTSSSPDQSPLVLVG
jgi:hypothetical protein